MKKLSVIFVLFIVLFFGIKSKAITQTEMHNWLSDEKIVLGSYETEFYNAAVNTYGADGFGVCYIIGYADGAYALILTSYDKSYFNNMTFSYPSWLYNNQQSFATKGYQYRVTYSNNTYTVSTKSSSANSGCYLTSYWSTNVKHGNTNFVPPIDWNNPYYSPAIETPVYEVTYRSIPYNQIDVPLNFTIDINNQSNLYCEAIAEYTLPNYLTYRPSQNYFEASQFTKYEKTIISAEEMVLARTVTASSLYAILTNKWSECLNSLPLSSVSIRFPNDFTAQQILDGRSIYDELRILCPFYGSEIKFYMRYFTIENNTKFVVGPWRIWDSVSPKSFNVELPSWYQPYLPASGNQGTSTSTETDPDVVVISPGGQTPTGQYYDPSINITVGSNVPNYPDYPTIASYNLDNMLVDTMNNVKGLSSFFGEFGSFLTVSFSFFPSWIWAIIGVGFGISIVVMFLKIL